MKIVKEENIGFDILKKKEIHKSFGIESPIGLEIRSKGPKRNVFEVEDGAILKTVLKKWIR